MTSLSKLKSAFIDHVKADFLEAKQASGSKEAQRQLLLKRKSEILLRQNKWIEAKQPLLSEFSSNKLPKEYTPKKLRLVVCEQQWQHDLWRIIKLHHWSMPPNEYVGRRKRILVFDDKKVVGLIGLASCIWGLASRDSWIGWDVHKKRERINYVVDAYVLGAIPPYNGDTRGSKLLAYLASSKEISNIWRDSYGHSPAVIVTTTLFGHSAVLNRVKHEEEVLWRHLGYTRGLGTMHFSLQTIDYAKELLAKAENIVPDRITSGPNWKLRLMRTAIEYVGLRAEDYLVHGYKRGIYVTKIARNAQEFLSGEEARMKLANRNIHDLVHSWEVHGQKKFVNSKCDS
jgi:hypothetical protein